jgi:hypothetical protein
VQRVLAEHGEVVREQLAERDGVDTAVGDVDLDLLLPVGLPALELERGPAEGVVVTA